MKESESQSEVTQSCLCFATPWTVAYQTPWTRWCRKLALILKKMNKIAPVFGRLLSVLSEGTHCLLKKTTIKTLHKRKLQSPFLCRVKRCSDAQHPLSASQATLLPRLCVIHSCWSDLRVYVTSSRRPSLTVLPKGIISSTALRPPEMAWCVS